MKAIELENLSHTFAGGRPLFRGLHLRFEPGRLNAIVGPSGCGKSSLLRLIAGLEVPTHGRVIHSASRLGFVFQEPRLLPWRSVQENLRLPLEIKGQELSPSRLHQVLDQVRLSPDTANLFPHQLSGGMKMRVALARALIATPDLLLMDEPLAALDESTREILQEEIRRLHEAHAVTTCFVTHSLSEALFLCDRIVVLGSDGELRRDLKNEFPAPRDSSLRQSPDFRARLGELSAEFRKLLASEKGPE